MEPVSCHALLEDPAPAAKDPDVTSQLPACVDGGTRHGAMQSKPSALYLKLLSLRVGLVGWYFCLKKIQWDLVRWIHISLELATDVFFSWVQNALLACMMLLLLAWKVHRGAKQHGWRTLLRSLRVEVQHAWEQSLLKCCYWNLKSFLVRAAWAPVCCFTWIICLQVRALEAVFTQAAMMAEEDQEEEAAEEAPPESLSALMLQQEERDRSGGQ